MSYIRTKDRIRKIVGENHILKSVSYYKTPGHLCSYRTETNRYKVADTIEELCDCYSYDTETTRDVAVARSWKLHNKKREIFGCIKTDKGLIYVAKMNDEGKLELL